MSSPIDASFVDPIAARADQRLRGATNAVSPEVARQKAEEFEAIFISQLLAPMFSGLSTDGPMGGGHAEEVWRGMLIEEYGKAIAKKGGLGVADNITRELLKHQEITQ